MKKQLLVVAILCSTLFSFSQINEGGYPTTFATVISGNVSEFNRDYQTVEFSKPNMIEVDQEDLESSRKDDIYRVGINIPVSLSIVNSGSWQVLSNGDKIWRLAIKVEGAKALGLYFSDAVNIPIGGKLHAYNNNHSQFVGAYTSSTPGFQAMEMIEGEILTLEYFQPESSNVLPTINISEIVYYYRGTGDRIAYHKDAHGFDQDRADACEIDVACSEISGWESQRDAAVRYTFSTGGGSALCSGAVVNNTDNDCKPYILTANHCGEPTSNSNITNHVWYFNYQRATCDVGNTSPLSTGGSQTMTGGDLKSSSENGTFTASANQVSGSDFVLVELDNNIPSNYNAYYAGWDRATSGSTSGAGIHHPSGHEKKISTYTTTLANDTYNGGWANAHWEVFWATTANGRGVTEGGSSGSAIFNSSGLVVGHLSGGLSACVTNGAGLGTGPNESDLYGKFNMAWDGEGSNNNQQLKHWLDPSGSNTMSLNGTYEPCTPTAPVANFMASATSVAPASTVIFTDLSSNAPTTWAWTVSPATGWAYASGTNANDANPQITFNTIGQYTISLTASNLTGSDNEVKNNYIDVTAVPNVCVATSTHSCGTNDEYFNQITLGSMSNTSGCSNYTDFTSQSITLTQGSDYNLIFSTAVGTITGTAYNGNEMAAWIDYNNDGTFDNVTERVGYINVTGSFSPVVNFTVPLTTVVSTVKMRVRISRLTEGAIDPCGTVASGEVEDYSINILAAPVVFTPVAQFVADQTTADVGTTINFTDQSTNAPTSWAWTVSPASGWSYDGGTNASSQNPQINFTADGSYSVTLLASNSAGSDSEVKTNYITIESTNIVLENELNSISVYPNPASNTVYINLNSVTTDILSIELKDVTGRVIGKQLSPNGIAKFNLSNESAGVYFITINANSGRLTKKVIKF